MKQLIKSQVINYFNYKIFNIVIKLFMRHWCLNIVNTTAPVWPTQINYSLNFIGVIKSLKYIQLKQNFYLFNKYRLINQNCLNKKKKMVTKNYYFFFEL